jgi:hypothetical protein
MIMIAMPAIMTPDITYTHHHNMVVDVQVSSHHDLK